MQLNPDLIRDILLYLEKNTDPNNVVLLEQESLSNSFLAKYTYDELLYHARQCNRIGYFIGYCEYDAGETVRIVDLSPDAHAFLANIRNDSNWSKVKEKAKSIGSFSLEILSEIAKKVIFDAISKSFL